MSEAFYMQGTGTKSIGGPSQPTNAEWAMPIPIGTFAVTATVEVQKLGSGPVVVFASLSPEGGPNGDIISSETRSDSIGVGMADAAERRVATLQAVVGTYQPAKVFLRCTASTPARVGSATMIVHRLTDPNHLSITAVNVA